MTIPLTSWWVNERMHNAYGNRAGNQQPRLLEPPERCGKSDGPVTKSLVATGFQPL